MAKFTIKIQDCVTYAEIEADNREQAINMALEWWDERKPDISVQVVGKHYHCPVNAWDCPYFSYTEEEPCLCSLENPMEDCDDFAACWDPEDEYWDEN